MPVKFVTAEEFAKLTGGYRGSVRQSQLIRRYPASA